MADLYRPGDNYVQCDRTGFKRRASECRVEWTGSVVQASSWEARHPQDKVRGVPDDQSVPIARPRPDPVFLGTNEVTVNDL